MIWLPIRGGWDGWSTVPTPREPLRNSCQYVNSSHKSRNTKHTVTCPDRKKDTELPPHLNKLGCSIKWG